VDHRYHLGIFVLDVDAEAVWNVALYSAVPRDSTDEDGNLHT
jgi:hypothetical protein